MGDEDKKLKNAPEPQSGFPQKKIVYGIIAIAVVILAVVVIAKFGYNMDLLSPASGEMSMNIRRVPTTQIIVQRAIANPTGKDIPTTTTSPTLTSVQGSNCPGIQTICSGVCVNLNSDPNHCGTCENNCTSGQFCLRGACTQPCPSGPGLMCDGKCVDIMTDPNNCGGCGRKVNLYGVWGPPDGGTAEVLGRCTNGEICYQYQPYCGTGGCSYRNPTCS